MVEDKQRNKEYVAKYRANTKKNEEVKREYSATNAGYIADHRKKLKEVMGIEEFKKLNAEYMKQYRAKLKKVKEGNKNIIFYLSIIRISF